MKFPRRATRPLVAFIPHVVIQPSIGYGLGEAGACEAVAAAMKLLPENRDVQVQGCRAIEALADNDKDNVVRLGDAVSIASDRFVDVFLLLVTKRKTPAFTLNTATSVTWWLLLCCCRIAVMLNFRLYVYMIEKIFFLKTKVKS